MRRFVALVLLLLLLAACSETTTPQPEAPISEAEASTTLRQVADLAAQRTSDAASRVRASLAYSCDGLSGRFRYDPASAPQSPPSIVCGVALPPIPGQAGARILVVTGEDADGHSYVGQVLVMRHQGHLVLHEPAYWEAFHYTQLVRGMAWGGSNGDPSSRAAEDAATRKPCTDPAAFITETIPTATLSP